MSSFNSVPNSKFSPNDEQMALMLEYVERYGPLVGERYRPQDDPEFAELFQRMSNAGFVPSAVGWVRTGLKGIS